MARRVEWTAIALDDLEQIAAYITRDSANYAASFVREAMDAARSLSDFADRGRVVPEVGDEHVRELFVGSYRLMYETTPDAVIVLAIIHGARDRIPRGHFDER